MSADAVAWPNPSLLPAPVPVSVNSMIQPGSALSPPWAVLHTTRCCSLTEGSPQIHHRISRSNSFTFWWVDTVAQPCVACLLPLTYRQVLWPNSAKVCPFAPDFAWAGRWWAMILSPTQGSHVSGFLGLSQTGPVASLFTTLSQLPHLPVSTFWLFTCQTCPLAAPTLTCSQCPSLDNLQLFCCTAVHCVPGGQGAISWRRVPSLPLHCNTLWYVEFPTCVLKKEQEKQNKQLCWQLYS